MAQRLLILSGFAIVSVILFHSAGWGLTVLFSWKLRYLPFVAANYEPLGSPAYYYLRVVEQFVSFSIPAFLFVSGYFVASTSRKNEPMSWQLVATRIRKLLIPYLVWCGLIFLLLFLEGKTHSLRWYFKSVLTGRTNESHHYVLLLCQYYLLSPLLVPLGLKRPQLLLILSGLMELVVQLLYYPLLLGIDVPWMRPFVDAVPKYLFPTRIFWFCLGIAVRFQLQSAKAWAHRMKWGLLSATVMFYLLGIAEWELHFRRSAGWLNHRETLIDNFYHFAFLFTFFAFDKARIPFSKQISAVGEKSYGIYLAHVPVMGYVARSIYHLTPWILAYQILLQPMLIVLGLAVPLLFMATLKCSPAHRLYEYVFG